MPPLAGQLVSDCVVQVPTVLAWEATLAGSGYTPPSPRNDSAKHIPTMLVLPHRAAGVAGDVRAWGVRTLPQIQSGKRCSRTLAGWEGHPSNTAASFGWVRSHTSATSCAALHAPASPLGSAMMANCSGRVATRVAAGSARTRCCGRRLVWGTVGEPSYFCGKRVGCGWYRRSGPSPPREGCPLVMIRHTPFERRH